MALGLGCYMKFQRRGRKAMLKVGRVRRASGLQSFRTHLSVLARPVPKKHKLGPHGLGMLLNLNTA